MHEYILTLSDEEERILAGEVENIQLAIGIKLHDMAQMAMIRLIRKNTKFNPAKMRSLERAKITATMEIEKAADRIAREKVELEG